MAARTIFDGPLLARVSALLLACGGIGLLFASDVILPAIDARHAAGAAWIGQMVAAGWLGVAALTWLTRDSAIGGIYGRPVVTANLVLYFISATVLLRAASRSDDALALWALTAVAAVMAAGFGVLMFRGVPPRPAI